MSGAPGTTEGPWHLSPFEPTNGGVQRVVMATDGFAVAYCIGRSAEEHERDAAQIIASPDLYDALTASQRVLRTFVGRGTLGGSCGLCGSTWAGDAEAHDLDCVIARNALALAKARGEA